MSHSSSSADDAAAHVLTQLQSKYAMARAVAQFQLQKLRACETKEQRDRIGVAAEEAILKSLEVLMGIIESVFAQQLTADYNRADVMREQWHLLVDLHGATVNNNNVVPDITVVSYNSQVHFGPQGRQAPCHASPFHMEDQTGLGSTEKK